MPAPKPRQSLDTATSAATAAASAISSALPSGVDIGEFIREQRQHAKLSLRRLAADAGVSNPYLSQIERGLRRPSAEILQQLAKGLRISAEQLYVQAGLLDDRDGSQQVEAAIVSDAAITERQKRVLLDIYASFLAENQPDSTKAAPAKKPTAKKRTAKKPAAKNPTATKPSAKKSAAKKPTAKKPSAKKSAAKKTPSTKPSTTKSASTPTARSSH